MTFQQIYYFVSVAECLNFTEAAKQNFISQPAISRQIKELEEIYECTFFERTKHEVRLTEFGKMFYEYARDIISMDADIRNRFLYLKRGRYGSLRIAILGSERGVLTRCLAEFSRQYPSIQIYIDQVPGREMTAALREQSHDFYFTLESGIREFDSLSYIVTHAISLSLICPKKWADQININDLRTLTGLPFAYFPRSQGTHLFDFTMAVCKERGYDPGIMNYYNSLEAVLTSVEAGICISILPDPMIDSRNDEIISIPIPGENVSYNGIIAWSGSRISPISELFLQVVKNMYEKEQTPSAG